MDELEFIIDPNEPLINEAEEERLKLEELWRQLKITKQQLASFGKSRQDWLDLNLTKNELVQLGFQKADWLYVFDKQRLLNLGFVKDDFVRYGFERADWLKLGFKKADFLALGYTTNELLAFNFTKETWQQLGFTKDDWAQLGVNEEAWLDLGLDEQRKRERRELIKLWTAIGLQGYVNKTIDSNNRSKPLWPGPNYNPAKEREELRRLWLKIGLKYNVSFFQGAYTLWKSPTPLWKVGPKEEVAYDGSKGEVTFEIDSTVIPLWDSKEQTIPVIPLWDSKEQTIPIAPFIGKKEETKPIAPFIGKKTEVLAKEGINPRTTAVQPIEDSSFLLASQAAVNANKPFDANKGFNIPSNTKFRANRDDKFSVKYRDLSGKTKTFWFDLLPAMENRGGSKFGNIEVPEVKPGILHRIDTKHKNIVVPGCTPVVQTIGINNSMLNLIGAMTGEENIDKGRDGASLSKNDVLMGAYTEPFDKDVSANNQAKLFMDEVVLPGTEVTVTVQASNIGASGTKAENPERIIYTGVIISYKFYAVRKNKAFYTIDLLITKYNLK
jgi:hypothetical protein